jgi:hypothetical protein
MSMIGNSFIIKFHAFFIINIIKSSIITQHP